MTSLPSVLLTASADASALSPDNRAGVSTLASLTYDFNLTGGVAGTVVPISILTSLFTSAGASDDANNANVASASMDVFKLNTAFQTVSRDASVLVGTVTPGFPGTFPLGSSYNGFVHFNMVDGAFEQIRLSLNAAASTTVAGHAFASADPYIFIDPSFASAADYRIEVSPEVGNDAPLPPAGGVPEPTTWTMMIGGFMALGVMLRRRRTSAMLAA